MDKIDYTKLEAHLLERFRSEFVGGLTFTGMNKITEEILRDQRDGKFDKVPSAVPGINRNRVHDFVTARCSAYTDTSSPFQGWTITDLLMDAFKQHATGKFADESPVPIPVSPLTVQKDVTPVLVSIRSSYADVIIETLDKGVFEYRLGRVPIRSNGTAGDSPTSARLITCDHRLTADEIKSMHRDWVANIERMITV